MSIDNRAHDVIGPIAGSDHRLTIGRVPVVPGLTHIGTRDCELNTEVLEGVEGVKGVAFGMHRLNVDRNC